MEVTVVLQQVTNNCSQEYNIAASTDGNVQVRQRRCTRIMWVDMNNLRPKLPGFDNIRKANRMGFSHIAAHDQYTVAINQVLWKTSSAATSQCCTQTGYSGAVSYTGLVLNRGNA